MPRRFHVAFWTILAAAFVARPAFAEHPIPGPEPDLGAQYHAGGVLPGDGWDLYRQYPHPGVPRQPTAGFPNYELPNKHYDIWFRPKAFGLTMLERCQKVPEWRPRGFGYLFTEPTTPDRIDYHRYVLQHSGTTYGPSYYYRHPDKRCHCLKCEAEPADFGYRDIRWRD